MDLSKVPDLELRQKVKPLYERKAALEKQIAAEREAHQEKLNTLIGAMRKERDEIEEKIEALIEPHPEATEVVDICEKSGLPVFDSDETKTSYVLACVG